MKWIRAAIPIMFMAACSSATPSMDETREDIISLLSKQKFENAHEEYFSNELQENLSVSELAESWDELLDAHGSFETTSHHSERPGGDGNTVLEAELGFSDGVARARMIFNEHSKLIALQFVLGDPIPEGIFEEAALIGETSAFELEGKLTLPSKAEKQIPAAVIVHGSGPSDLDGAAYAYKPYKDIAWGLAKEGIAVLRYDKRTLVYPESFNHTMTIQEETVEDAILAASLLANDERFSSIFLVGHSLGGMAAPRIMDQTDDFMGMVALAGSLRPFTEIIHDQNLYFYERGQLSDEEMAAANVDYEKSKRLHTLQDDEVIFGMPALYFKDLQRFDSAAYLSKMKGPILIMQGKRDFQVTAEEDFPSWEQALQHHPNATLKLYPRLNHMFIDYDGPSEGTLDEYMTSGNVDKTMIRDLAEWLHLQTDERYR